MRREEGGFLHPLKRVVSAAETMKPGVRVAIGSLVVLAAVGYLMFAGFGKSATYYLSVDELAAKKALVQDRHVRVNGKIVPGTIVWDQSKIQLRFAISGERNILRVEFDGIRPDNFQGGRDIIVEGQLMPSGVFKADKVMVRCPSKYEEEQKKGEQKKEAR